MNKYLIKMIDDCEGRTEFIYYETDMPVNVDYMVTTLGNGFSDIHVYEEVE